MAPGEAPCGNQRADKSHGNRQRAHHDRPLVGAGDGAQRCDRRADVARAHAERQHAVAGCREPLAAGIGTNRDDRAEQHLREDRVRADHAEEIPAVEDHQANEHHRGVRGRDPSHDGVGDLGEPWREHPERDASQQGHDDETRERLGDGPGVCGETLDQHRHGKRHEEYRADGGQHEEGGHVLQIAAGSPRHSRQERRTRRHSQEQQAERIRCGQREQPGEPAGHRRTKREGPQQGQQDEAAVPQRSADPAQIDLEARLQHVARHEHQQGDL